MLLPAKVDSTAKDLSLLKNSFNLLKYNFPAEIGTLSIALGDISFAISSAFKNSNFFSDKRTSAKVLFPLPFAPAIIYRIFSLLTIR